MILQELIVTLDGRMRMMSNMELTIDNIIKLLETQGIGSKQLVLNLLKNADETQLTQLYQSALLKLDEKRRR